MSPQTLVEIMKNYRPLRSRYAYLQSKLQSLERFLRICTRDMIEDQVSMSQAITGMPHGSSVGDPTGRLALDIASGKVSMFVSQIREEIGETEAEIRRVKEKVDVVELVLNAMNERERLILEMKMIDELSWAEIINKMNRTFGGSASKRSLQRFMESVTKKAFEIVR